MQALDQEHADVADFHDFQCFPKPFMDIHGCRWMLCVASAVKIQDSLGISLLYFCSTRRMVQVCICRLCNMLRCAAFAAVPWHVYMTRKYCIRMYKEPLRTCGLFGIFGIFGFAPIRTRKSRKDFRMIHAKQKGCKRS